MASTGRRTFRPISLALLTAAICLWNSCHPVFIGSSSSRGSDSIARLAYDTILRRDPFVNKKLQSYCRQQEKLETRQSGKASLDVDAKNNAKVAKLRSLGLGAKADALEATLKETPPWHLNHVAVGDVYEGYIEHPDYMANAKIDLKFEVTGPKQGILSSRRGQFEGPVSIQADFPISARGSPKRTEDQTAYIFQKLSPIWRDFEEPVPTDEQCSYLPLFALRAFFKMVTVDPELEHPPVEEFERVVADPYKGMTREEFLKYTLADDATYLDQCFPKLDTGRRIQISEADWVLDGDFQVSAPGFIIGFCNFQGNQRGGEAGTFTLQLRGTKTFS